MRRVNSNVGRHTPAEMNSMLETNPTMARQIAETAAALQHQHTGHAPKSVSVVLSGDTLVVTLHGALSPAEQALVQSPDGAAKVQEFHRQLFLSASDTFRKEIRRITGVDVREATAEVEPATGSVLQVFTTGTMVQVFLLSQPIVTETWNGSGNPEPVTP
jgi:uncharacterized protein YbcI